MEDHPNSSHIVRKVIVIGSLRVDEQQALADGAWSVLSVRAIEDARPHLEEDHYAPVVVILTDPDSRHFAEVRTLAAAHAHRRWLALVEPAQMGHLPVRALIGDYFWDYCTRPVHATRLTALLGHAAGMTALVKDQAVTRPTSSYDHGILGESPAIVAVRRAIDKLAKVDAPLLIVGESGVGKELAARAIHAASQRSRGPFAAVNCAALPPTLIHAELFGHEKGAFTGAHHRKIGQFESANTGTLFLDEIGDLPEALQTTLLRFLEEDVIRRVGGTKDVPVDLRIISATHVDLRKAIKAGRFREDLYFRLDVLRLRIPALRERGDDIRLLAEYFLHQFTTENDTGRKRFSHGAWQAITAYPWPGNVRELRNRVYRAVVMSDSPEIAPADMGLEPMSGTEPVPPCLDEVRACADRQAILAALSSCHGDTKAAADVLQVSRATLYRLMEKNGIRATIRGIASDDAA